MCRYVHWYIYIYGIYINIDMYIGSMYITTSDVLYKVFYIILTSIMKKLKQFMFLSVFKFTYSHQCQVNVNFLKIRK